MSARVVVLMSWYDESPTWLAATVASVAPFAHHVVALDGAYCLFPDGKARSPIEQAEAVLEAATAAGMGCTVVQPSEVWWGNEVEKRAKLFDYGRLAAGPDDWFLILDADELVTQWPVDLHQRLTNVEEDVAFVTEWDSTDPARDEQTERFYQRAMTSHQAGYRHRKLFRNVPGLTVRQNHFRYDVVEPDGSYRRLWGEEGASWPALEPAADMSTLRVRHRLNRRTMWRGQQQHQYYKVRETMRIEDSGVPPVAA